MMSLARRTAGSVRPESLVPQWSPRTVRVHPYRIGNAPTGPYVGSVVGSPRLVCWLRFYPAHAEPECHVPGHFCLHARFVQVCLPFPTAKTPGDGYCAIGAHDRVPTYQASQNRKAVIRQHMAMKIGDMPAIQGLCLKPGQKLDNILVTEVMRELRANDEIWWLGRVVGKYVARLIVDGRSRWRCPTRGDGASRIQIDA
jgi:hypothetical protein